jgi:hypothetical protein
MYTSGPQPPKACFAPETPEFPPGSPPTVTIISLREWVLRIRPVLPTAYWVKSSAGPGKPASEDVLQIGNPKHKQGILF